MYHFIDIRQNIFRFHEGECERMKRRERRRKKEKEGERGRK